MKVAPVAKKAKPLHKITLKLKSLKAGAAGTKKKKETLLKGFAETSLSSEAAVPKASIIVPKGALSQEFSKKPSPQKRVSSSGAQCPKPTRVSKMTDKLSTPKRKSLQVTSPPIRKVSLKENKPTPAKHSDKDSVKAVSSNRKSSVFPTPATNVDRLTSSDQAPKSPIKRKSLAVLSCTNKSSNQIVSPITNPAKKLKLEKKVSVSGKKSETVASVPESSKQSQKSLRRTSVALSASSDVQPNSITSNKLLSKRKLVEVLSTEDNTTLSDQVKEATKSGKKNHLKQKALPVSISSEKSTGTEVSHQAKPAGEKKKLSKGKVFKKSNFFKEDGSISKPNLNVEAKEESAVQMSSRKRFPSSQPKLEASNDVSKQTFPAPLAADGEVSCSDEPAAAKKKFPGKQLLNGQINQAGVVAEKLEKLAKKATEKKTPKRGKAQDERKDVSKDSRLQDLQEAAAAVLSLAEKKFQIHSKKQLFAGDAQPVFLQIHTFRVPRTPPRVLRFNLPHSIHEDTADICLILADPIKGRKRDTEQDAIVEDYKEMLESKGVKNIKEVIPFNYLRSQYSQYEMKRRFANSYDVILCDSRFVGHATHFLGKHFFSDKCITPIRVVRKGEREFIDNLKSAIEFSLHKTWMRIHPRGTSFNLVVGNTKLTSEQIAANTLAVFNDLQVSFPGGLDNIKMAMLKCHEGHPVPVFVSLKPHNEVPVPVVKSIHRRHGIPATGELSTLPGREVTVFPSGRINIRNKMTAEDEEYVKIMGQESRWKRAQSKLEGIDDEAGSEEEEKAEEEEGLKDEEQEEPEDKKVFSKERDPNFRGKKPFQSKKIDPRQGKKLSPGKKVSHGKKSAPGKKFSPGKKMISGRKLIDEKKSTVPKQGKKASQKS